MGSINTVSYHVGSLATTVLILAYTFHALTSLELTRQYRLIYIVKLCIAL